MKMIIATVCTQATKYKKYTIFEISMFELTTVDGGNSVIANPI